MLVSKDILGQVCLLCNSISTQEDLQEVNLTSVNFSVWV